MQTRSAILAVLCLFLVAIGSVVCDVSSGTITLGVSLTTSPIGSSRALQSVKILNGLNFWLDKIAATSKEIRGQTYRFELKVLEDDGTASMTLENYRSLMNDTTVDYLLGPVGSETSNPVANLTESHQRLLIGTAVSSTSFYLNKEYAFSVVTASTRCPTVAFPYYRLRHAPRLALLISEATSPKEACEGMTSREVSIIDYINAQWGIKIYDFDASSSEKSESTTFLRTNPCCIKFLLKIIIIVRFGKFGQLEISLSDNWIGLVTITKYFLLTT
jgi:hypothetical protein